MKLTVNGEARESTAADLDALFREEAEETGIESPQGIAIALNGSVVRRRDWALTALSDGDRVEIVRAMQGG
ncbi:MULTISPECIES: sulfur carrier protein ThiS [unclassified Methylobacterium]|jgi:sulfur carrier protein|uniref:sulfur carrier protein ThiS n=1 Tax=unclassified Methylobacterium TaxID=2615210 RepID=UPI0006F5A168|nr:MULTISPECIES: sulfur carrier protein ThiS [unclassified Methylobacterium]KQO66904.1 thiamine biosynthesis protein ThiS [Methylobacterium sp. Leaf89]KQO74543.1 thiamine biosynthesis protein ThiS [Methylobacterium sp. Leaf88]KQP62403.1 thiamine biosynthesis protein ThiS [Methylobacterium sp. Leaf111]KQT84982.1 thiamine biosynthesis protein ThiS [Methylobacterium sp. Leaf465]KQU21199.1 thiamine biosynthesis protein ThiS [Methylobacterium sp. Leaf94]